MTANEVRKKFLEFFAAKGHTIVASDSVVPKDDPTVLFTTAGMQQFKRQFLGHIEGYTRAASSQKCLRTDDLEKVGKTPVHHTFFEMLGNFSFGDYFKKEAIEWAWEFFTEVLKIPKDKLWVSVYKEDSEAENVWHKTIGLPKERILKLGDKDNFWPAEAKEKGPNGPCGPCSEIFYDFGVNPDCPKKDKCDPTCDCGRFAEVWNLVFTQFNRKEGGVLEPLPAKNIDTGMGLERLVAVIQGKKNNYDTDLFGPIIKLIDEETNNSLSLEEKRVIADHIRAIVFGINDGVNPSNEWRGYVVRKLIVECSSIVVRKGIQKPVIYKLVPTVINIMNGPYPELTSKINSISSIIKSTEESVIKLLEEKLPLIEPKLRVHQDDPKELGKIILFSYSTLGVPVMSILDTAKNIGISSGNIESAKKVFNEGMDEEKKRSRGASKMTGDVFADAQLNLNVPKTQFLGYEQFVSTSKVLKLFVGNEDVKEVKQGAEIKIVLDKTPFYAESGGQVGDTGSIIRDDAVIRVTDTQKIADVIIHSGKVEGGAFKLDDLVQTQIDDERRLKIMRNHTATHLLQAALRQVLGHHVQQQGSLVDENRLRFDFTHPKGVSRDEILQIESIINTQIMNCDPVQKEEMDLKKAKETGAMAFFAEKYKDRVRVVSIDGYSKELCGGTHLKMTGQIGLFRITSESSVAQGIRRIEAVTGTGAWEYSRAREAQLEEVAQTLKAPPTEIVQRTIQVAKHLKHLEKQLERYQFESIRNSVETLISQAESVNGAKIVTASFTDTDANVLRQVSDLIRQKAKPSVVLLGSQYEDNAFILISVTEDLVAKGIRANDLVKKVAPLIEGSGGGRPDLAQAGSKSPQKIAAAMSAGKDIIKQAFPS